MTATPVLDVVQDQLANLFMLRSRLLLHCYQQLKVRSEDGKVFVSSAMIRQTFEAPTNSADLEVIQGPGMELPELWACGLWPRYADSR